MDLPFNDGKHRATIRIKIVIVEAPELSVSVENLDFGETQTTLSLEIKNDLPNPLDAVTRSFATASELMR